MKKCLHFSLSLALYCLLYSNANAQCTPVAVTKTNATKVYVHFMPWFAGPINPTATGTGYSWGPHWTTDGPGANPNSFSTVTDYTGASVQVRNIVSHFHPLIGPYDETDPYVEEYHLLLMKLSGIDGIMIDWYGLNGNGAGDAGANQTNSAAMIAQVGNYGLKYGLVVEDGSMTSGGGLPANLSFAQSNYFTDPNYIKLGDMRGTGAPNATAPLVAEFEPEAGNANNAGDWSNLLNSKAFLPLYGQAYNSVGGFAGGTFLWPYPQAGQGIVNGVPAWYNDINSYYNGTYYTGGAPNVHNNFKEDGVTLGNNVVLGAAYQGFFDYYRGDAGSYTDPNGTCCTQYGIIPRNYGPTSNTLATTLNLAQANKGVIDGIQIATWNDFTEGTIVEPTVEYGFQSLVTIQKFTGAPFSERNLRYIDTLYMLRKQYSTNPTMQTLLSQASCYFNKCDTLSAQSILTCIVKTGSTSCSATSGGPTITGGTASVVVNNALNYTISATSSSGAITGYNATGLVPGLNVNTSTGVISGTPVNVGIDTITVSATNSSGTSSAILYLTINQPTSELPYQGNIATIPGVIQAENYDWGGEGVAYHDNDATNNGFAYRLGEGVDIENNTDGGSPGYDVGWTNANEWMKYTVNVTTAGTYTMTGRVGTGGGTATTIFHVMLGTQNLGTIHVPNTGSWTTFQTSANVTTPLLAAGQQTLQIFEDSGNYNINYLTFTLNAASPAVTSNTASGTVGAAFNYTITASNTPTSYTATPLPAGLIFNTATGVISGTPTAVGSTTTTITATNAGGTGSGTVTITINPALMITSNGAVNGIIGTSFTYTITSNTVASYSSTALPPGLTLDHATGVISGTPTLLGVYPVTITATNANGSTNNALEITITNEPPVITSVNTQTVDAGEAFSYAITATNEPSGFTAKGLPAGIVFNSTTGEISGSTTITGVYTVTLGATNAAGTGTEILTLTIAGADTHFPPSMSPVLAPNPVRVDQLIQVSTPQWNVGQEVGIEVYNYLGVLAASENNIIVTTIELLEDKTDTPYSGPGIGINLPNLIAGDYILVLRSSDGRIVKKFRVQ